MWFTEKPLKPLTFYNITMVIYEHNMTINRLRPRSPAKITPIFLSFFMYALVKLTKEPNVQ